ncbi:MAG: hypothetical protein ACKO81_11270 [Planctomycetota bacterium]
MNSKSFIRKVIYIVLIGALLIPLSLISRPASVSVDKGQSSQGGKLAQLRDAYGLSQTRVSEIDPTSETMKLLSLGLRGVAVNLLWLQAMEDKRVENYDQLESTLNALIKIQPNFVKVWEFQAHNISYNISMEFDDFESRYHWVKKGIKFLTGGIGYNRADHRITDNLGMFTGMKIGNADEKVQYRRLFRKDREFQDEMTSFIDPDDYDTRQFGHDHWLMAYYWYEKSRVLVDEMSGQPYTSDIIFYSRQPAQKRSQAMSLQKEFRSDEQVQQIWNSAREEWEAFGRRPMRNSQGLEITLNGLAEASEKVQRFRDQLDELVPGARTEFVNQVKSQYRLDDADKALLDKPAEQRTDEENVRARLLLQQISNSSEEVDVLVFQRIEKTAPEKLTEARDLLNQVITARKQLLAIDRNQGTANYAYWVVRNEAESTDEALDAHQKLFDANELRRKSIFDDEYMLQNGEKKILRRGAISVFNDSFAAWAKVIEKFPRLGEGDLASILLGEMAGYQDILKISGTPWPMNFPLQKLIDERSAQGEGEGLPTTEELEEERSAREESTPTEQPQTGNDSPAEPKSENSESGGGDPAPKPAPDGGENKAAETPSQKPESEPASPPLETAPAPAEKDKDGDGK